MHVTQKSYMHGLSSTCTKCICTQVNKITMIKQNEISEIEVQFSPAFNVNKMKLAIFKEYLLKLSDWWLKFTTCTGACK